MSKIGITFFLLMFVGLLCYPQTNSLFEEGNALYNDGKFAEAIEKYEAILNQDQHSAELYFNLGNAHYKLNNIGPSIYYYEKGLQLRPNDREIQNNIAFARNMTIDVIEPIPEVGFAKFLNSFARSMSFDGWSKLGVLYIVLFTISFLAYYFSRASMRKRALFFTSLSFLVLVCLSVFFAYHSYNIYQKDRPAIVFAEETQVKSEPNLRGSISFTLHEGTKVQILESVENWKKIRLADGKTGWMIEDELKLLKDF
ncbi:MAG: tetratricopeptide repeat protein [Flavobacteriaceae bacterium]|nr:tetratricopeptide repeat protein [Flavobacteriaceae bacterium]